MRDLWFIDMVSLQTPSVTAPPPQLTDLQFLLERISAARINISLYVGRLVEGNIVPMDKM